MTTLTEYRAILGIVTVKELMQRDGLLPRPTLFQRVLAWIRP